jgi:hypothetical protein
MMVVYPINHHGGTLLTALNIYVKASYVAGIQRLRANRRRFQTNKCLAATAGMQSIYAETIARSVDIWKRIESMIKYGYE